MFASELRPLISERHSRHKQHQKIALNSHVPTRQAFELSRRGDSTWLCVFEISPVVLCFGAMFIMKIRDFRTFK